MADETQNVVASTETATEEKATQTDATKATPYVYYYSDPDETNPLLHHLPIPSFIDLSDLIKQGKLWKIYDIPAPDNSMEDPVIDLKTNSWVENDKNAQTKILAQAIDSLKAKGEELDQAHSEVDQAVKAMQQVQAQSSQQNVAMMKSFTAQTQNTNKMLATMQQTLAMVVKAVQNSATPEAPEADAPVQPATDKQENGGN